MFPFLSFLLRKAAANEIIQMGNGFSYCEPPLRQGKFFPCLSSHRPMQASSNLRCIAAWKLIHGIHRFFHPLQMMFYNLIHPRIDIPLVLPMSRQCRTDGIPADFHQRIQIIAQRICCPYPAGNIGRNIKQDMICRKKQLFLRLIQ